MMPGQMMPGQMMPPGQQVLPPGIAPGQFPQQPVSQAAPNPASSPIAPASPNAPQQPTNPAQQPATPQKPVVSPYERRMPQSAVNDPAVDQELDFMTELPDFD